MYAPAVALPATGAAGVAAWYTGAHAVLAVAVLLFALAAIWSLIPRRA